MNRVALLPLAVIVPALTLFAGTRPPRSAAMSEHASLPGTDSSAVVAKHVLTLDGANLALATAVGLARERHAGAAVAVVDDGGNLIALQRLDGTFAAGAAVSIGKARTAALFKKPTKAFEEAINGGRTALAAVHEMTPLQGAVPIMYAGEVVGAIGVSGAHSQQEDEEIAMAGAAAVSADSAAAVK